MSDYAIGVVVEGTTDLIVIQAALGSILAGQTYTITQLQPESSDGLEDGGFGSTGSGWGGVYRWCRHILSMGEDLTNHPSLQRFDIIIIHVDADVAEKNYNDANIHNPANDDLPCVKPCPPAGDSVQALKHVVLGWLDLVEQFPESFVLCIPSKCTEAWVSVALYGQTERNIVNNIECRADIENYLAQKPARERLIRNRDGRMKKITASYSERSVQITEQWNYIAQNCEQANIFSEDISAVMQP